MKNWAKWHNLHNDGVVDTILKGKSHQIANFGQVKGSLITPETWVLWVLYELYNVWVWFDFRGYEPNLDSRWTHKNMKSHAQTKQNCKIMGNQGGTLANAK